MPTPSIGAIAAHTINGPLEPFKAQTTEFKQFGADGNGLVIGPRRQPISKLTSKYFTTTRALADSYIAAAMAIIGTVVSITRDTATVPVVIADCTIKDCRVLKTQACVSLYGGWQVDLEWDVYAPAP